MEKTLSWAGFGLAMVLMVLFVPVSKDSSVNAVVGMIVGIAGGVLGARAGRFLDRGDRE